MTWSQTKRGLYYINWVEIHKGLYFFNGSQVWQADHNGYNYGYHQCDQGYGIGYDVSNNACPTYGDPSTYRIQIYDYFKVSLLFRGFPVHANYSMHLDAFPSGAINWYG